MARKKVILEPQERFDIVDATALQTLTYSYISEALGGLMGWGAGMLTPLPITNPDAIATTEVTLGGVFAFYQTKTAAPAATGEVVVYNPQNPAQTITTIDFAQARAAATIYYDENDITVTRFTSEGPAGSGAFPILWARAATLAGAQDARRQWSVALQTEVPVTINTREQTYVEFQLEDALSGPVDDGAGLWVPIAKVVGWSTSGVIIEEEPELGFPSFQEISVWDNLDWFRRTSQAGYDRDGDDALDNFWSQVSSNITAGQIMNTAGATRPWGSRWHTIFSDIRRVNGAAGGQLPYFEEDDLVSWLLDVADPLDAAELYHPQALSACDPFKTSPTTGTGGIVDILNALRAVVKNLACDGIRDYPAEATTPADTHPLAALTFSGRVVHGKNAAGIVPGVNGLATPYGALSAANIALLGLAAAGTGAKLRQHGDPDAQWHAKPLRSVNAMAVEQVVQNETIKQLEADLTAAETAHAALAARVVALEANDPFQNAPIGAIEPLLPLGVVSFRPFYSHRNGYMRFRAGPPGFVQGVRFVMDAECYTYDTHASGFVEISFDEAALVAAGIDAADLKSCPMFAQPVHIMGDGGWLTPHSRIYAGGIESQGDLEMRNLDGAGGHYGGIDGQAHERQGKNPNQVLKQFGNFFQCTLNVVVGNLDWNPSVRVYPVSTVPDYIGKGRHLRGYPHMHEIMHWYLADPLDERPDWWGTSQSLAMGGGELLFGDVTNPLSQYRARLHYGSQPPSGSATQDYGMAGGAEGDGGELHMHDGGSRPERNSANLGWGENPFHASRDFHENHWGVKTLPNGRLSSDDLRSGAPTLTFLRPDRFHYGYPEGSNSYDAERPHLFNNSSAPTNREAHSDPTIDHVGDLPSIADQQTDGQRCTNGRFMPAFHLVVYRPAFATLGGAEGNAANQYCAPGVKFIAPSLLPVEDPPEGNPHEGGVFAVSYKSRGAGVNPETFFDGTEPAAATAAGPGLAGDVSRVHVGDTKDQ